MRGIGVLDEEQLTLGDLHFSPAGERSPKGIGAARVDASFKDEALDVWHNVSIEVRVEYSDDETYEAVNRRVRDRAREVVDSLRDALSI